MLYDGVLTYDISVIVSETECYADTARHIVVLPAEDAFGLVKTNNVIVIYDMTDRLPIIITERCDSSEITLDEVKRKIEKFNNSSDKYIATISESGDWIDVTVTRRNVYDVIEATL